MGPRYLVRHGETAWNLVNARRLVGAANDLAPLTQEGERQILLATEQLLHARVRLVVSSPMTRALQSAALISRILDVPLVVEFDLHEWVPDRTYTWDRPERVVDLYQEMQAARGEWPREGPEPVWEPLSSVRQRAQAVLDRYAQDARVLAFVTHAVVIGAVTGCEPAFGEVVRFPNGLTS